MSRKRAKKQWVAKMRYYRLRFPSGNFEGVCCGWRY
jgi:hypothetical protein